MEFLAALWLPILVSAVFVFVVSSIIHMALPIHANDMGKLACEDDFLDAMRKWGAAPGTYMFPGADSMKDWSNPELLEKIKRGPVGRITLFGPGGFNMGKSLAIWFALSLLVATFAGYLGWHGAGRGADYLDVFRMTGTGALLGYAFGHFHDSIWKGQSWGVTAKFIVDGIVYALVTAGTFGWLWPA
jgi:hypothetical protein